MLTRHQCPFPMVSIPRWVDLERYAGVCILVAMSGCDLPDRSATSVPRPGPKRDPTLAPRFTRSKRVLITLASKVVTGWTMSFMFQVTIFTSIAYRSSLRRRSEALAKPARIRAVFTVMDRKTDIRSKESAKADSGVNLTSLHRQRIREITGQE